MIFRNFAQTWYRIQWPSRKSRNVDVVCTVNDRHKYISSTRGSVYFLLECQQMCLTCLSDLFDVSVCISDHSVCLSYLFLYLIYMSAGLSVCLFVHLTCLPVLPFWLWIWHVCLSVCLPICLCCWPLCLSLGAIGVHCSWGNEHGRFVSSPWKPPRHTANCQKNVGGKTCHFPELQLVHLNNGCQGKQADFVNYIRHQTKIFFFSCSRFLP